MDIKTFTIKRFDLEFVLCWNKHQNYYYIQALESGEWVEDFSDLPHEPLPETRDDEAAIRAVKQYVDHVREEMVSESTYVDPEPNWEAQAAYDELHGTINGEAAGIVEMRELWGEC